MRTSLCGTSKQTKEAYDSITKSNAYEIDNDTFVNPNFDEVQVDQDEKTEIYKVSIKEEDFNLEHKSSMKTSQLKTKTERTIYIKGSKCNAIMQLFNLFVDKFDV